VTASRGKTLAVLQARTSSTRLPGKVLKPLAGEPMILRQLERIARAKCVDSIVVATSTDPSDDELAAIVESAGYRVVRGPLSDVLARFVTVIEHVDPEVVVRLTGDCPLTSPQVIDQVIESFHRSSADYVSNTLVPTFPDGLDVEVVTARALCAVAESSSDPHEHEHVTLGVYRRVGTFSVENVTDAVGRDNSRLRWTVDNPDDYAFAVSVYDALYPGKPDFDYEDVLDLVAKNPALERTQHHAARNATLDGLDTGAMRHRESGDR